ncbi:hypothetical protein [Streptomyces roseirectus]|uniref:hypothetical protein n=1 Tax=Streptomyces roseirectus TaxID=2768066 RepID=UPI0031B63D3A
METRDRLAAVAAAEGLSLRAWLDKLAEAVRTPGERAGEAERTRQVLLELSGYDPAASDPEADALLARRMAEAA